MRNIYSFEIDSKNSLVLSLEDACIQTMAKRAHREIAHALLSGDASVDGMEVYINLLERFLSTTNFTRLRSLHPELAGGTPCSVRLYPGEGDSVQWEVIKIK